jgi:hypothetical protein
MMKEPRLTIELVPAAQWGDIIHIGASSATLGALMSADTLYE